MKYYFDTNSDGYLSKKERNNAALISAKYWKISSFKGIKYFPNLKYLDCGHYNLTSLDLLGNKKLEKLNCDYNKLTALSTGNTPKLRTLYCGNNSLKTLNVSKSRSLQKLFCKPNKLTKLDVRKNKKLTAKGGIIDADKGVKIIKK